MKNKLRVALVLVLPIIGFSYEINFSKKFQNSVSPDLLSTSVSVNIKSKNEVKINNQIEEFNNFIKNSKLIKIKNGSYSLSPEYDYSKDKQEFVGYNGHIDYNVVSSNAKDLNSFIQRFVSLKKNHENAKLSVSNISWIISEKEKNKSFDNLRIEAIKWIGGYSLNLSKELNRNCIVKSINIGGTHNPMPIYRNSMSVSRSEEVYSDVAPSKALQNIDINPSFSLECK